MTYQEIMAKVSGILEYPLIELGSAPLTVASVLMLILALAVVLILERAIRRSVLVRLLSRTRFDPALQQTIARFAGFLIILSGCYVSLQLTGIHVGAVLDYRLITVGATTLTVSSILALLFSFAAVLVLEGIVRRQFLARLLSQTRFEPALQYAIARFTGYFIIVLGFYISLQMVGINLSSLAILAGAVGVGVGFGLQNIVNNFVSGLIILAERPISLGDRVEVAGVAGQVRTISLRSTTVVTNDNISIIVPNANFISEPVTNWSHGDTRIRFRIPFGVAYGSDIEKLRRVMIEVAADHPAALKEPAPDLFFDGFGDSSLNFELVVWSAEMTFKPRRFRSDLNYAIEKKLREHDIEIPFPQRDLHLRSGKFVVDNRETKKEPPE